MTVYHISSSSYSESLDSAHFPKYDSSLRTLPCAGYIPLEMPELLCGSDYSGDAVTVSNHRVFMARWGDVPGVHEWTGSHGGYGVLLAPWALWWRDANGESIADTLDALTSYSVLDESDWSEVEREAENSAWDDWARRDFVRALQNRHIPGTGTLAERWGGYGAAPDDGPLFSLFCELCDRGNIYWENETGNIAHIDVERVARKATVADVAGLLIAGDVEEVAS